ncbi:MAG: hypothetical protein RR183_09360 [Bacteroidales bacterium]
MKNEGARPGAGRKWIGHVNKKAMQVYLSVDVANYIDEQTKLQGVSRGKIIDVIVSNYVQDADAVRLEIY